MWKGKSNGAKLVKRIVRNYFEAIMPCDGCDGYSPVTMTVPCGFGCSVTIADYTNFNQALLYVDDSNPVACVTLSNKF